MRSLSRRLYCLTTSLRKNFLSFLILHSFRTHTTKDGDSDHRWLYILAQTALLIVFVYNSTTMPQNDYIELHKKRFGERLDAEERRRKK